jgi:hypothetical protein
MSKVSLPPNIGNRYTAPSAAPWGRGDGAFPPPTPLNVSDDVVKNWVESLPDIPLPRDNTAAVWFDDFAEVKDPRTPAHL